MYVRRIDPSSLIVHSFDRLLIQPIVENVSSSEFTFTIIVTIIISVFVPERSRDCTNPRFQFLYQDTEMIIVKIIVKVNSEEDTFSTIGCTDTTTYVFPHLSILSSI
jgi:hypothetical protein